MPTESRQNKSSIRGRSVLQFAFTLILLLISADSSGFAQFTFLENGTPLNKGSDSGFMLDTPTRIKIDLSGAWDYAVDGGPSGSVRIPSAYDFRGKVVFQRGVELTKEQLDQYRFHIVMLGVNYAAEVSVNGEFVTSHNGGYTSFVESLPRGALQIGHENTVRVTVSNELDSRTTIPVRPPVWGIRNYGGITRDVYLLGTPLLYIKDAVVRAEPSDNGETARVTVRITADGADSLTAAHESGGAKGPAAGFFFEILDKMSGALVAKSPIVPLASRGNEWDEAATGILVQSPRLWSPESPDLYIIKCYLAHIETKEPQVVDEYDVTAGIRRIGIAGDHLQLNGKRLQIRGVCWYEDSPARGSAMTYDEREKDVALIKTLGTNLIRFIGHPPHPYMLNLCDRYGLCAMEEIPLVQTPGAIFGTDAYADLASAAAREMVVRDRNHPCVIAWGLGDEIEAAHPSARPFMQSLVRLTRTLDSRLLYCAVLPGADSCTSLMDIGALSLKTQEIKSFRTEVEQWRNAHRHQPLVVVKLGTEVQSGNRNGYSDPLSQEAQARFYLQRFDLLKSIDCDGGIVWSFNDWKGERPSLTVRSGDPWMHTLGLVSAGREKRLAFDAVRSIFHGEKFVALPAGNHANGAPIVYVLAGFVLLVGMAYIYNTSRRFRESLNRSVMNSYNFFADVRDQRIVAPAQSTLLGAVVSLAVAIAVSSILYRFRDSVLLDAALSYILTGDDAKAVAVTLIWNPLRFIGGAALLLFLLLLLVALVVRLLRAFVRARIYAYHAYTVTMWSTAPMLVLVPLGMVLYRVLDSSIYVIPAFVLMVVLCAWVFIRLLKGMSIILDVRPVKMYLAGLLSVAAIFGCAYAYFDYAQSMPVYLSFLYITMLNTQ